MGYSPLTTVFTPPATCTTSFSYYAYSPPIESETTYITQEIYDAPTQCYPPGYDQTPTYSPGVCPIPFTTANFVVSGGVTTAVCCPPSGYHDAGIDCQSAYTTSTTVLIKNGTSTYMGVVGPGTAAVPYIVVLHASRDLPTLQWASLSTGSKAGIGIGSVIILCLVIGTIVFFYRRRRRVRDGDTIHDEGKPEMDGIGVASPGLAAHELPAEEAKNVTELHGGHSPFDIRSSQDGGEVFEIAVSRAVEKAKSVGTVQELSAAHGAFETHSSPVLSHEIDSAPESNSRTAKKADDQHLAFANAGMETDGLFDKPRVRSSQPTSSSVQAGPVSNDEVEEDEELRMLVEAERRGWTS